MPIISSAQDRQLRLGSTVWPPFTNVSGQPQFAFDLVSRALRRSGIIAESFIVEDGQLTPSLLNVEFDGSPALWKETEREQALIYSEPYLENRLILVGRQGSDVSATSLSVLAGKRVALVVGYAYGEEVEIADGPIFVSSSSVEDSFAKLLAGEADYTLMDDLVIYHLISNYAEEAQTRLAFGSAPLLTRTLHFAVQRSLADAESIISRFNSELESMIVDHSYNRLLHLDWIQADVDGDGLWEYLRHADQTGPRPPARSYQLFAMGREATAPEREHDMFGDLPTLGRQTGTESDTTLRFYFEGDIYEGWSAVPEKFKTPDYSQPPKDKVTIFTIKW